MTWMWFWILSVAYGHEIALMYTTDLSDTPTIEVEHLGEREVVEVELSAEKDGFTIWIARWQTVGGAIQHLSIQHRSTEDAALETVFVARDKDDTLYLLNQSRDSRQQWLSSQGNIEQVRTREESVYYHRLLWLISIGVVVIGLRWRSTTSTTVYAYPKWISSSWVSSVFFALVSLWLYRGVLGNDGIPARFHDALGTYWLLAQSDTWQGLFDPMTNFPEGANYQALDSYVLWGLSHLLSVLSPLFLYKALLLVFPALSAWMAERWARALAISAPWSWLVGLGFGFSGLVSNAILEGQVYQCFTAGIPMTGLFVLRYVEHPTWRNWLGIMVGFLLCLFSSSYLGASCLLLLFGMLLGTNAWRQISSLWVFAGVFGLMLVHYGWMSTGGIHDERQIRDMIIGSVSLSNFWGSSPEMDREGHAIALGVSALLLVLITQGPEKLFERRLRFVWLMGVASLAMALGPMLNWSHLEQVCALPTHWLYQQSGFSSIGFPVRLAHPFLLAVGLFAGVAAQSIAGRLRWGWLLIPLMLVELEQSGVHLRQSQWSVHTPTIDDIEGDSIFTLYPLAHKRVKGSDMDISLPMLDCVAQVQHQKAIVNNCLSVNMEASEQRQLQQEMLANLTMQNQIFAPLLERGIELLLVYPELFKVSDRTRLQRVLEQQGERVDAGVDPMLYWVYRAKEQLPVVSGARDLVEDSTVTIDIITSRDEQKPLLIIGDGVFKESVPQVRLQTVRHRFRLNGQSNGLALLIQNSQGRVIWEGTVYPNPGDDQLLIRPNLGPQIELPLLNSPPILLSSRRSVALLFGTLFGLMLVGRRTWFVHGSDRA